MKKICLIMIALLLNFSGYIPLHSGDDSIGEDKLMNEIIFIKSLISDCKDLTPGISDEAVNEYYVSIFFTSGFPFIFDSQLKTKSLIQSYLVDLAPITKRLSSYQKVEKLIKEQDQNGNINDENINNINEIQNCLLEELSYKFTFLKFVKQLFVDQPISDKKQYKKKTDKTCCLPKKKNNKEKKNIMLIESEIEKKAKELLRKVKVCRKRLDDLLEECSSDLRISK